ncbi:MAG: 5'-nucleotidase, partial [Myxococcota bacterium]
GIVMPELLDDTLNGVYAADAGDVATSGGTANDDAVAMRDALNSVIEAQYDNVIGHTDVFLEGRRNKVRTEETNLGNLTADANKWYTERCDSITSVVSLKNGGGIRAEIGDVSVVGDVTTLTPPANFGLPTAVEGDVSEGHFRGTLRFDNGLVVLDMTGIELKTLLEHGVATAAPGITEGEFPQVGGISFGYDPASTPQALTFDMDDNVIAIATPGTRITDLWVDTNGDDVPDTALFVDGVEQPAASDTLSLVTLNFLANGGDDFPFALLANPNRRQLYEGTGFGDPDDGAGNPIFPILTNCDPGAQDGFSSTGGEQDAIAEYFLAFHPDPANAFDIVETDPIDDRRIQNLDVITDFVAPPAPNVPLIITGVIDGPLSGGQPKAVELYALQDISDLAICGIGSANNGGGTDGEEYTFTGATTAGSFLYIADNATDFDSFFGFAPTLEATGFAVSVNGDDAVELFCNGLVVDTFGDINVDGTGQAWEYLDGWAYRNDATGPDGTTFAPGSWTYSGVDALEGESSNSTATTPFPTASYAP